VGITASTKEKKSQSEHGDMQIFVLFFPELLVSFPSLGRLAGPRGRNCLVDVL
jgi:hypothetical protein